MATAKQFLDQLELGRLIPNDLLDELYEEYRESSGAISADAIARRLVSLGALSQEKADEMLQTSSESFVQLGSGVLDSGVHGSRGPGSNVLDSAVRASNPEDPFDSELKSKKALSGEDRDDLGRRKHVKKSHKNDFDSPLLLIGGGVLALLVLAGAGLAIAMSLQSGDQLLQSAQEAYASGSYSQARDDYEKYVEDYAGAARWSEARVQLAVVRLRQATETARDWSRALAIAEEELPQVEDESAFAESRGEFASLLPRIARGLAESADAASADGDQADKVDKVDQLVERASAALTMVGNTKYVPKSLRDEGDINGIRELLDRVSRRREAQAELKVAVDAITNAASAGDIRDAYAAHSEFVIRRPELREDAALVAAISSVVDREKGLVRFQLDPAEPQTVEAAGPVALPLANPRTEGAIDANGVFTATWRGVLYAVNTADGALVWRRPIGVRLAETLPTPTRDDLLIADHRRGELLRVNAASGELVWRVAVEPPGGDSALFAPVDAGDRVLVASESGKLWFFDSASGARRGFAQFSQPLRSSPGVDSTKRKAYVAGQQSSLYTLDTATGECVDVRYTEHARGAIATPPLVVGGRVLVIENTGAETSQMVVYSTDEQGLLSHKLGERRLEGVVATPPSVSGRRVLVSTESGAVYQFEVMSNTEGPVLSLLASQAPPSRDPQPIRVVEARGEVWLAGVGLRRTAASLADSQLVARALADPCDGDRFVGPLERRGSGVLHARVREGASCLTVGSHDTRSGSIAWETDLGAAPLGAPRYSSSPRGVVASNVEGETHLLGPQQVRARKSAKPVAAPTRQRKASASVTSAAGDTVLTVDGAAEWLKVSLAPRASVRGVRLPSPLDCAPAPLGAGLLTPLRVGQVCLLDARGEQLATPFQPRVAVGEPVTWTDPATGSVGGQPVALLTDGEHKLYCLALEDGGDEAALTLLGEHELTGARPTPHAAIAAGHGAIGLDHGALLVCDLPRISNTAAVTLPGKPTWGPHAAGEVFLVATAGTLHAVDASDEPRVLWSADLGDDAPIGEPLADDGAALVTLRGGALVRWSVADGAESARVDLGETLGSGPTAYGPRLLVAAADGTVLVVSKP